GKLVLCGPLDEIKKQHRQVTLRFGTSLSAPPVVPGAISITGSGKEWGVICNGARDKLPVAAAGLGAEIVDERTPSLSEIFVAYAGGRESSKLQPPNLKEAPNSKLQ